MPNEIEISASKIPGFSEKVKDFPGANEMMKKYYPDLLKFTGELLWHYTDIDGFMKILTNRCLWASHSMFLNDSKEITHGIEAAKKAIEDYIVTSKDPKLNHSLENIMKSIDTLAFSIDYYVVAFCRNGDLLSQWRGYGGPNSAVSIGFDYKYIYKIADQFRVSCPFSVIYNKKIQHDMFAFMIDFNLEKYPLDKDSSTDLFENDFEQGLMGDISGCLSYLKDQTFEEENEYRWIIGLTQRDKGIKINHRVKYNYLVPYIETKLDQPSISMLDGIKEIIVGPTENKEITKQSIAKFLRQKNFIDLSKNIKSSEIPYRP